MKEQDLKGALISPPTSEKGGSEKTSQVLETSEKERSAATELKYKPMTQDPNYLVYEDGRLYSLKAKRFLKGKVDNAGLRCYSLAIPNSRTGNRSTMFYAHRLVAELFLDNPEGLPLC